MEHEQVIECLAAMAAMVKRCEALATDDSVADRRVLEMTGNVRRMHNAFCDGFGIQRAHPL